MTLMINRCRVLTSLEEIPRAAGREDRAVVVYDAALADSPGLAACERLMSSSGSAVDRVAMDRLGTLDDAGRLGRHLAEAGMVVAYGGGSLIDSAKVALALGEPLAERVLRARQRSGWVLGPDRPRAATLVAVPTTVGTATEVSGIATFVDGAEKRAFTSLALQPDIAVLDARATAGIPHDILIEGCLEIILRCVGPVIGTHGDFTGTDQRAVRLATRVVRLLCGLRHTGESAAEDRARLALLSAATHQGDRLRRRAAFTVKAWFIGNNLSARLGVRKMTALANLMPGYWAHLTGTPGLGSARRLMRTWAALRAEIPVPVSADPAAGFAEWLTWLGVPVLAELSGEEIEIVTRSCVRQWGAGLPMLAGIEAEDIRAVLRGVRGSPDRTDYGRGNGDEHDGRIPA